jgi:hypothetical protein
VAEKSTNWEKVHPDPLIFRHLNRGNLWLVNKQLLFVPGLSLSDLIALTKSTEDAGKPVVEEAKAPAAAPVPYPKWVVPHESWISHPSGPPFVEGYKFSVDRDSNVVSVYAKDRADEQRLMAPKQWKK